MKAILVEDEINAQNALRKMLQLVAPKIEILAVFESIEETVLFLNNNVIDFLFLDIKLKDGSGFELLQKLENHDFSLIFTTAFNDFAIKAFKFNAIDYLLKPIDPTELKEAIERAENFRKSNPIVSIENFASNQKIVLKTSDKNHIVPVSSIIRLEADGAYTLFVTENQKILISKNIKFYEELLSDYNFIRCHQSHLVSISKISELKNMTLKMINNDVVPISFRKKQLLKSLF